ncbi:hypothetical protein EVAR_80705_1 [Eumeta japonica]|uniref:Uncharacterized protein n=1 Tax=Eumeta variegata TaxID=151549 RepID=A0A4C1U4X4_EUMVA|nr:hypothetical protein EVAR_80705_1 [Eumeta japonica]
MKVQPNFIHIPDEGYTGRGSPRGRAVELADSASGGARPRRPPSPPCHILFARVALVAGDILKPCNHETRSGDIFIWGIKKYHKQARGAFISADVDGQESGPKYSYLLGGKVKNR